MSSQTASTDVQKKDVSRKNLKETYNLTEKSRAILVSRLQNSEINDFLTDACKALDCVLLTEKISEELVVWADAVLLTGDESDDFLQKILSAWVVPILPKKSKIAPYFEEFNPMKFKGNAFFYKKQNKFLVFEKICNFLENRRYPGDKKILTKNIKNTLLK